MPIRWNPEVFKATNLSKAFYGYKLKAFQLLDKNLGEHEEENF